MKPTTLFFDFYTMSLLRYFTGDNSLNHQCRVTQIEETYENKVNDLYSDIRRGLEYSVVREFRHYSSRANSIDAHLSDVSYKCATMYRIYGGGFWNGDDHGFNINQALFCDIYRGFANFEWDKYYGGLLWGKAANFLTMNPKTSKDKELWIDRVLDLQHNTGHILNKTKYGILSKRNQFKLPYERGRRTALNYRKHAKTLTDLYQHSSVKVRKLAIANSNYIPEIIR